MSDEINPPAWKPPGFGTVVRSLYRRISWLDQKMSGKDPHPLHFQERRALVGAVLRTKLNFALIEFIKEQGLVPKFLEWYQKGRAHEERELFLAGEDPQRELKWLMSPESVFCPFCGSAAELTDSSTVYASKRSYGMLWVCRPCDARVGCHKNDPKHTPLGTLANAEGRKARQMAHEAFDPIWQAEVNNGVVQHIARRDAYAWLSGVLEIDKMDCHIAMFDLKTCVRVIDACAARWQEYV